jgi:nickel-dependent lactate racemase
MRVAVQYGTESTELDVRDDCYVPLAGEPPLPALQDVADAVTKAIEQPHEFPPLRQAIVPGDHVTIVVDDDIPSPANVLGPIVECLADGGVAPGDITIMQVAWREDGRGSLTPDNLPPGIRLVPHDPDDRGQLSYLASTKSGTRVYLNRHVVDADLVILLGRVDYHPILGYRGTGSSVFPGLADAAAQQQFRGKISGAFDARIRAAARHDADEVAWLLGVQFAIQVVVGENDRIVEVVAGAYAPVQARAQQLLDRCWKRRAARRADLVVATIRGAASDQGFEELGRSLDNALALVRDGGRVAVLSSVGGSAGAALQTACSQQDPTKLLDILKRQPAVDTISTWQIVRACQSTRVYLLSRLDQDLVEELSITPIDSVSELQRLVHQSPSCVVLNDAPRVSVESEHAESAR